MIISVHGEYVVITDADPEALGKAIVALVQVYGGMLYGKREQDSVQQEQYEWGDEKRTQ